MENSSTTSPKPPKGESSAAPSADGNAPGPIGSIVATAAPPQAEAAGPNPKAVDLALRTRLATSCGTSLAIRRVGDSIQVEIEQPGDVFRARAVIHEVMAPAKPFELGREIEMLRVATRSKAEGEQTARLRREVFLEILAEYPRDVAVWACRQWRARESAFFPSEIELRELCDGAVAERRAVAFALEAHYAPGTEALKGLISEAERLPRGDEARHWLKDCTFEDGVLTAPTSLHVERIYEAVGVLGMRGLGVDVARIPIAAGYREIVS